MTRWARKVVRQSHREKLLENKKGLDHWAAMSGKPVPAEIQIVVPEKRAYTKRTDGRSEHAEQCTVIDWWDAQHSFYGVPHFALFAVPNGAHLSSAYIGAGKLKREGMRRGAFDLILAVPRHPFHGWFGEMKFGKNTASDEQEAFGIYLNGAGYAASFHWSADSAIASIKTYLTSKEI